MALRYERGLVLRMDPVTLRQHDARSTLELDTLPSAQQDFACIGADARAAYWLPLSATPLVGCREIPATAKAGERRWTDAPSYYQPDQCWHAPHKAAQLAAAAAHDRSNAKSTNTIAADALPAPSDFPALTST